MKKTKLLWKLFPSFLAITAVLLLFQTIFLAISARAYIISYTQSDLISDADTFKQPLSDAYINNDPQLQHVLADAAKALRARVSIVLTNGDVVVDSTGRQNLPNISKVLQDGRLLQSTPQSTIDDVYDSNKMIVCSIPILDKQELLGAIIIQTPMFAVSDILSKLGTEIFLAFLISILLAALATWLVSKQMTSRLEPLKKGLAKLASGDLSYRIKPLQTLELSQLAEGLNETTGKLKVMMGELESQRNMLDSVLESMTEGVMAVGPNERLIGANGAACRMLGVKVENVRGKLMQEVTRSASLLSFIQKSLQSDTESETEIAIMADSERLFQVHSSILKVPKDTKHGIIIVLSETTDLRHLETVRKDFVANVSHELRTPITSIKGFVETLISGAGEDPNDRERFLQIIQKHTVRLNRIIEDMLELSSIEESTQKGTVQFEISEIATPINSAISFISSKVEQKGLKIEASVETCMCRINPQLIEHAVSNYVDNAINFSQPDTIISVSGRKLENDYILEVKDHGQGMEKRHLPRIFERFYRAQAGRDRNTGGGTGLGLAIVKHIISAHEGKVWADSELGVGSTFSFSVPLPKND
ncbi:MAG: PAS domain-containing protein [Caldisericia bacterium]|nr:PAS domain-containing protein [Caldisericia bacterium]